MFRYFTYLLLFFSFFLFSTSSFTDSHSEFNNVKWSVICGESKNDCISGISKTKKNDDGKLSKLSVFFIALNISTKNEMKIVDKESQTYKLEKKELSTPTLYISFPLNLNVDLAVNPLLRVDGEDVVKLIINTCNSGGCKAKTALNQEMLDRLKGGKNVSLLLKLFNQNKNFQISVPLKNFTKSYKNLVS